jgi:hypothetical protein
MKAWIGPVLAAAQTAHERPEDATSDPDAPGIEDAARSAAAQSLAPGSAEAGAKRPRGRGFVNWWRRWRA